jgi:hypothetical protein
MFSPLGTSSSIVLRIFRNSVCQCVGEGIVGPLGPDLVKALVGATAQQKRAATGHPLGDVGGHDVVVARDRPAPVRSGAAPYWCGPNNCYNYDPPPPSGPTFNPQPNNVVQYGVQVTYDDAAGTITYSEIKPSGTKSFDPSYCQFNDCSSNPQPASHWLAQGQNHALPLPANTG